MSSFLTYHYKYDSLRMSSQLSFPFMRQAKEESDFARGYNSFSGIDIKATFGKGVFKDFDPFWGIKIIDERQLNLPGVE